MPSLFVSHIHMPQTQFNPNFNCQMQFHQERFSFNIPIRSRPRVKRHSCRATCAVSTIFVQVNARAQYSTKMRNRVKRKPRFKLNFHVRYMRITLRQTACSYISHLENNPAVDHDPISAERTIVSTVPYVMHAPRSITVIKWPFTRATQKFQWNMDLIYSPMRPQAKSNIPRKSR